MSINNRVAALGLIVGGGVLWAASRMQWLRVATFDDKSGEATNTLVGATWATEQVALALVLIAAAVAALVVRVLWRRVVAVVALLAAAAAAFSPLQLLTGTPDSGRAHALLAVDRITQWSEVTDIAVLSTGPLLAVVGAAIALVCAVLLLLKPGVDRPKAYDQEPVDNDFERQLWNDLDADIDPTDG